MIVVQLADRYQVAFDTRDLWFESSHWKKSMENMLLLLTVFTKV